MFAASAAPCAASGVRWQPGAPSARQLFGPKATAHERQQHQRRVWQPATTPHRTTVVAAAAAADGADDELELVMRYGKSVAVPPELAAGLAPLAAACSVVDVTAVARAVAALDGPRQQGVLDHGLAVAAYLQGLGIKQAQLGRLLCRCPKLFSWLSEERAGLLFSQLMRLGLSAGQAAGCFEQQPQAAATPSFEAAIAVLAPLMAAGTKVVDRSGEQLLGDVLKKQPSAVTLLQLRAELLQRNVDNLLQLGLSKQQVKTALLRNPALLTRPPERLAKLEAVLQQELGADRQLWVKVLHRVARVATCREATLRQRAQALVAEFGKEEAHRMVGNASTLLAIDVVVWRQALAVWASCSEVTVKQRAQALVAEFGKEEALRMVGKASALLAIDVIVWRQTLAVWRLCGVSDQLAVVCNNPNLIGYDWLNPSRLANLLALQQLLPWEPSAAQVIERYGGYVAGKSASRVAGRLLYLQRLGLLQLLVADKQAARREWRQSQQEASAGKKAAGEPVFISVGDIAASAPAQFACLVHGAEAWLSEDSELVSSSPSFDEFTKGLKQLPAWQRLRADAYAAVAELKQQLPPELLRAADETAAVVAEGGTG